MVVAVPPPSRATFRSRRKPEFGNRERWRSRFGLGNLPADREAGGFGSTAAIAAGVRNCRLARREFAETDARASDCNGQQSSGPRGRYFPPRDCGIFRKVNLPPGCIGPTCRSSPSRPDLPEPHRLDVHGLRAPRNIVGLRHQLPSDEAEVSPEHVAAMRGRSVGLASRDAASGRTRKVAAREAGVSLYRKALDEAAREAGSSPYALVLRARRKRGPKHLLRRAQSSSRYPSVASGLQRFRSTP